MLADFARALEAVLLDLALQVVRDGEGAQKLVRDRCHRRHDGRARRSASALAVAKSPLVKTAIAGEDANWGRIVMAVGKAGEPADRDRLSVGVGGVWMARDGGVGAGLRRGAGGAAHEGARGGDRHRPRPGPRQGHGVDLRPDARLHRHQRLVSVVIVGATAALVRALPLTRRYARSGIRRRPPEADSATAFAAYPDRRSQRRRRRGVIVSVDWGWGRDQQRNAAAAPGARRSCRPISTAS